MCFHIYLYEEAREAHSRDLLCDVAKERLLTQLPLRPSINRRTAAKLGLVLLWLGTWLKQFEQSPGMLEDQL